MPLKRCEQHWIQEGVTHFNEVFGMCPDQIVSDPKWHKPGDLRATVAPFLANMTIGPDNFKWMLFGYDDTIFFIDNVLNLLPHLDPTVPYFMTDHLWYPDTAGKTCLVTAVHLATQVLLLFAALLCSSSPQQSLYCGLNRPCLNLAAIGYQPVLLKNC